MLFILIPGAGGDSWYFHRLEPELTARGHDVVAVDLPADRDDAGLDTYVETVLTTTDNTTHGDRVVVVAQSMGGLTGPIVAARRPVDQLVLLNAMVPLPGETGGEWWAATGQPEAAAAAARADGRSEQFDPIRDYFHDVPERVTAEALRRGEPVQSDRPFADPWPLDTWPDVPTRFIQSADDRQFPLDFQRRVVDDRLGIEVEVVPGGHLVALSQPVELARQLLDGVAPTGPARS